MLVMRPIIAFWPFNPSCECKPCYVYKGSVRRHSRKAGGSSDSASTAAAATAAAAAAVEPLRQCWIGFISALRAVPSTRHGIRIEHCVHLVCEEGKARN